MSESFRMHVRDMFRFADGRTVLVGTVEGGEQVILRSGPSRIFVDDREVARVNLDPEMVPQRTSPMEPLHLRAVSTREDTGLTREIISRNTCRVEGKMSSYGHRHLLGIDSPPPEYAPDTMTLGPRLPDGWDGDAWKGSAGDSYFLRAWNKATGHYAIGRGAKYEEARQNLLNEIRQGMKRVVITVTQDT